MTPKPDPLVEESQLSTLFCITTDKEQQSLTACQTFQPNTIVRDFESDIEIAKPDKYSLQVSEEKHIYIKPAIFAYINHSCNPNIFVDTDNFQLVCLRNIEIGEHITFFYPSTEWSMATAFSCRCGFDRCLGWIDGASKMRNSALQSYRLSSHISRMLKDKEET